MVFRSGGPCQPRDPPGRAGVCEHHTGAPAPHPGFPGPQTLRLLSRETGTVWMGTGPPGTPRGVAPDPAAASGLCS